MIDVKKNIAYLVYTADRRTRNDLITRQIVDEREYMSRLITLVEYPYGFDTKYKTGFHSYFLSKTLSAQHEQRFGCDVLFSFRYRNVVKLLCIESKRLDFRSADNWDNFDPKRNSSRFTRQIRKQAALEAQGVLVYEMFLNDEFKHLTRPGYDREGSSLVVRSIADSYCVREIDSNPRKWNWGDADQIVRGQSISGPSNLKMVVESLLDCQIGIPLGLNVSIGDTTFNITLDDEQYSLPVPDLNDIRTNEPFWEKVRRQAEPFMEKLGLSKIAFFQNDDAIEESQFFQ